MAIGLEYWRKVTNNSLKRKVGTKGKPKDSILIVCEGSRTEPNYFNAFRITSVKVHAIGIGAVTESLVRATIQHKQEALKCNIKFDEVWCVFDKDSNSSQSVNNALVLERQNNIQIAYSNKAFELWYLLHFEYMQSGLSINQYIDKLSKYLNKKYDKSDTEMYSLLMDKQHIAIQNAKKLISNYSPSNPDKDDPSTTVHDLVIRLNKLL